MYTRGTEPQMRVEYVGAHWFRRGRGDLESG